MKDQEAAKKQENRREESGSSYKSSDSARLQKSASLFVTSLASAIAHGNMPKTADPSLLAALGQIGNGAAAALLSGRRAIDDAFKETAKANTLPTAHAALLSSFITANQTLPENELEYLENPQAGCSLPEEIAATDSFGGLSPVDFGQIQPNFAIDANI